MEKSSILSTTVGYSSSLSTLTACPGIHHLDTISEFIHWWRGFLLCKDSFFPRFVWSRQTFGLVGVSSNLFGNEHPTAETLDQQIDLAVD